MEPPPAYNDAEPAQPTTTARAPARQGPRLPLPLNLPALNMIRGKRVILASASPRRRQLLAQVSPYAGVKHDRKLSGANNSRLDR